MLNFMSQLLYYIFAADLLPWEEWFRGFCIGFLIFGSIVTVLVLVTFGISAGQSLSHDIDHDADISLDKDVSIDKDLTIDKDISIDKDLTIDKDISVDKDVSVDKDIDLDFEVSLDTLDIYDAGPFHMEKGGTTPLMLSLAVFSISFGGLGLLLFWQEPSMNPYLRLVLTLLSPIILSIIVNVIWQKISRTVTYRLPTSRDFIGREAIVSIKVNSEGGLIRVEIPDQIEPLKVPAKAVHKQQEFLPGEVVYIINVDGSFYLVDDSLDNLRKRKIANLSEAKEKREKE